jgi:hypothetical protein
MDTNYKLIKAGWTILRTGNHPSLCIKKCIIGGPQQVITWKLVEKDLPSKAERERRLKKLLEDPKTILEVGEHRTPFTEKAVKFVMHVQDHLKPSDKVVCKICGKTIDEIWEESDY